jgi:hypothetical protein
VATDGLTSDIAGAANAEGRLEIFARGADNAIWHIWQTRPNSGWSGWSRIWPSGSTGIVALTKSGYG